jgi:hypothetical protein
MNQLIISSGKEKTNEWTSTAKEIMNSLKVK